MKSLRFLTICGATIMLVACTKDDVTTTASFEELKAAQPTPVAFSTYMGDQAVTRAGTTGDITDAASLNTAGGFGVFAYYTNKLYPNTQGAPVGTTASALAPNFMYNQQVACASGSTNWTYSPIKYWPNDFNGTEPKNVDFRSDSSTPSTGTNDSYLSFFAYAPYVATSSLTSQTTGITAISANTATSNPTISYKLATSGANVDLLWGTYSGTTSNVLGTGNLGAKVNDGLENVNINLQKQKTGGSVGFAFKHALSKVGFTVQADPDDTTNDGIYNYNGTSGSGATLITVNSLDIAVVAGDYTSGYSAPISGTFDLATGVWNNQGADIVFNKSFAAANLNNAIAEPDPSSAPTATSGAWSGSFDGVQKTAESVGDAANLLYLPGSVPTFKITITYTIRTADANLASPGCSVVSQTISNKVAFSSPLELNKKYTVNMKLGITGVKFTASVSGWGNGDTTTVNLPLNVN